MMKAQSPLEEHEKDLDLEELDRAINNAKNHKAAGDDQIPNEFVKHLGPVARQFLLHIYQK